MVVSDSSRAFYLRPVAGGTNAEAASYGSSGLGYGEPTYTYGQQVGESTLIGVTYRVVPLPGWVGAAPAWKFRQGDTSKPFQATIVEELDPTVRIDMDAVATANLYLTQTAFGKTPITYGPFGLTLNTSDDTVSYVFGSNDAPTGLFRVLIKVVFDSDRVLTVDSKDTTTLRMAAR